jgi:hypothetical protein
VLRPLLLSSLALTALLPSAGCKKRIEYHRVDFPGFSLEVPEGMDYGKDPVTEYRAGQVQWQDGSRLVIVSWQAGSRATVEEMPLLVRTMAMAIPNGAKLESDPAQTVTVSGHQGTRVDARIETMSLSLVDIDCGKRSMMIGVGAMRDLDAMRKRVLDSFQCQPIAEHEQPIGTSAVPFGVDDPSVLAGWERVQNDDMFTMSKGTTMFLALQVPRGDKASALVLDKAIPELMTATGAAWTNLDMETRKTKWGERMFRRGHVKVDDEVMAGVVTVWPCDGRADAVLAMAFVPTEAELGATIDFISGLRCANPDDPPIQLPAAAADEGEAEDAKPEDDKAAPAAADEK